MSAFEALNIELTMKASNANIIAQLNRATESLIYSCAGDSPVWTFVWEVAEKGEFNIENMFKLLPIKVDFTKDILTLCNYLVKAESNSWTTMIGEERCALELYQFYQEFINFLLSYLPNLQVYKITIDKTLLHRRIDTKERYCDAGNCYIGIGRTIDGDWIGIAHTFDCKFMVFSSDEEFLSKDSHSFGKHTHKFLQEMEIFMKTLSQSCISLPSMQGYEFSVPNFFYIFQHIIWEVSATQKVLFRKLLYSIGAISTRKFCGTGFPEVDAILRLHLINLRSYQFMVTQRYWLGETQEGDWIGVTAHCYPG